MRTCNFIFLCCIFVTVNTLADEIPEPLAAMTLKERPKIGLALSGGGARGAAHIGVLHVLEELRIPIDYIAGTSMGAIIGGLYASGMHSSEIETAMLATDWVSVFEDETPRPDVSFRRKRDDDLSLVSAKPGFRNGKLQLPPAFVLGQKFDMVLNRLTLPVAKVDDFNKLKIPFRAITTNIITGEEVILSSGSLAVAMRASMSVPGAFAAIKMGDKLLVDGGVANNLPVDVVRAMGADIVIAIDISTPLLSHDEVNSALSIVDQLTGILTRRNTEQQLASLTDKDVLIVPQLGDISAGDFGRAVETIPEGIAAAELQRVKLQALSLSELDYAQYMGVYGEGHLHDNPVINFVHIDNQSRLSDDFIAARLRIKMGERLDVTSLEEDVSKLYGLDLFESVRYEIKEQRGSTGLVIHVREKRWGPDYLQFGFSLSADFEGSSSFNTAVAYTRTAINKRNGEWRTLLQAGEDPLVFTEFYQPVDVDSRYYVTSKLVLFEKINFNLFDKERIVAGYRLNRQGMSLAVGRELGEWGDIRVGIQRFFGDAKIRIGDPNVAGIEFDNGEAFVRFSADKVDDLYFPTSGYLVDLKWIDSHRSLGADTSFDQVLLDSMVAITWDRQTFFSGLRFFSTTKNEAPIQNRFRAGGLQNLSGFQENELSGKNFGLFRLGTMRRINDIQWMHAYAGFTLEVGNVWEKAADVFSNDMLVGANVFLGVDSAIGPFYLAYGYTERGNHSFYIFLGRPFGQRGRILSL